MKTNALGRLMLIALGLFFAACGGSDPKQEPAQADAKLTGMSGIKDNTSQKNIVQIALGSSDHTTLVAALQAAGLVDALANPGPFTVFAPTNAAFDKLPKGTVESLLKPEKKNDLAKILQYHVQLSAFKPESFKDGQTMTMFSGQPAKFNVKDGKMTINGDIHVLASVPAANGIVYIIDGVMLAPAK